MEIKRGRLYVIDFNPRIKTKPGKLRPALVLQSDLVNEAGYPSTIVIPTTTQLVENPGVSKRGKAALSAIAIFFWAKSSPWPTNLSGKRSAPCPNP
jgi:mRNA-degrading endonuclease toxin of MazEF toxin-antitoxin module